MIRKLFRFHGGVHLPEYKQASTSVPITLAQIPERLIIPLLQHHGEPAKPIVNAGDNVFKGQMIAQANGHVGACVHASSSGKVVDIGDYPIPHPSGLLAPCIVIATDGLDTWHPKITPLRDKYKSLSGDEIQQLIKTAGIVGLGGAGFPSHIKLDPNSGNSIDTLIINGAECEPYVSCDEMLMRQSADEVITGALIMQQAVQAKKCIIALEDNKPEAFNALTKALSSMQVEEIGIVKVPTIYPTGGEKQLIRVLTGKEILSKEPPVAHGIVCHNVATTAAVYRAVYLGEPLISRFVTVTGNVSQPGNLEVRIGTPIKNLISQCGGNLDSLDHIIIGGPMMGFALNSVEAPIIKTSFCVLARPKKDGAVSSTQSNSLPCIRCGYCADTCPVNLLPQQLYWHARAKEFDKIQQYYLFDCIECGCCDYVCPSHIPLVHFFRFAKAEIRAREQEKQKADLARQRYESRLARLQRDKAERTAKHEQKLADLAAQATKDTAEDAKKAAIQAALERVHAKRRTHSTELPDQSKNRMGN